MRFLWKQWRERNMRTGKSEWKGTRKVLAFTFSSLFKGKANLATLIVFLICGLLAPPLFFLFGGSGTSAPAEHELSRVAVYNETELPVGEILSDREDPQFADVLFEEGASEYAADPAGALGPKEAAVRITREASGAYQADLYAAEETELSDTELEQLSGWFQSAVKRAEYRQAGMTEEQMELLTAEFYTETGTVSDYRDGETEDGGGGYGVQLVYAIVVLMVSILAVSYIIRSVVEEKSSRLVEMLLLHVRPMALIAGKILAILAYIFCVLGLFLACLLISGGVCSRFAGLPGPGQWLQAAVQMGAVNLGAGMIVIMAVSLFLGCLTLAVIAGISGAGCSSMDDISGASTAATLLIMAGYFVSIMVINLPSAGAQLFVSLCPVLSVFCAPVQYAMGNISFPVLVISWLVQAAVLLWLVRFCAKIYRSLIMYRGNRLTWKDMIGMAEQKPKKGRVRS